MLRRAPDGGWFLAIADAGGDERRLAILPATGPEPYFQLYSLMFRDAGGAWLIGVRRDNHVSGPHGSFLNSRLLLFSVEPDLSVATTILDVPMSGSANMLFCPGTRRHPAPAHCVENESLESSFDLDLGNSAGGPRFVLGTRAVVVPGPTARRAGLHIDSRLWAEVDPACTYRRVFSVDPASGQLVPDAPLPDCSRYFRPDLWVDDWIANPDLSDWQAKPR